MEEDQTNPTDTQQHMQQQAGGPQPTVIPPDGAIPRTDAPDAQNMTAATAGGQQPTTTPAQTDPITVNAAGRVTKIALPALATKYVYCEYNEWMNVALMQQLEVLEDKTYIPENDKLRDQLAMKFFKAAQKWKTTPPTGTDFPGTVHNILGWAMVCDLQHPLFTGNSINLSRLQFAVPATVEFRNLVLDGQTEFVLKKLGDIAAKGGEIPMTLTAEQHSYRTNITAACPESKTMANFLAELACNSSQWGLGNFQEMRMDLSEEGQLRQITWSPQLPREKDAIMVNKFLTYACQTSPINDSHKHPTQTLLPYRGRHSCVSHTHRWGTAHYCNPSKILSAEPRSSTSSERLKQWPTTSWSTPLSWGSTNTRSAGMACCGGRTLECPQPEGTRTSSCTSSRAMSCRQERITMTIAVLECNRISPPLSNQPPTRPPQVVQINHLRLENPRFGQYQACMESTEAIRQLPKCGPIAMGVKGRFSMVLIADAAGPDCPSRYAVSFHIGTETDVNLMRAAGRKILRRALDLKHLAMQCSGIQDEDVAITLLTEYDGSVPVAIKRSELATLGERLDKFIFLQSGMSLDRHIAQQVPNPTILVTLRGATKVDAFPLFLAGKTSIEPAGSSALVPLLNETHHGKLQIKTTTASCDTTPTGSDDEHKIYSGSVPIYSYMHHHSIAGYLDKRRVVEKGRWSQAHLIALSAGCSAEEAAATMFTPKDVSQASANLLRGDEWAQSVTLAPKSKNPHSLVIDPSELSIPIKTVITLLTPPPHMPRFAAPKGSSPKDRSKGAVDPRLHPARAVFGPTPPPCRLRGGSLLLQAAHSHPDSLGTSHSLPPKGSITARNTSSCKNSNSNRPSASSSRSRAGLRPGPNAGARLLLPRLMQEQWWGRRLRDLEVGCCYPTRITSRTLPLICTTQQHPYIGTLANNLAPQLMVSSQSATNNLTAHKLCRGRTGHWGDLKLSAGLRVHMEWGVDLNSPLKLELAMMIGALRHVFFRLTDMRFLCYVPWGHENASLAGGNYYIKQLGCMKQYSQLCKEQPLEKPHTALHANGGTGNPKMQKLPSWPTSELHKCKTQTPLELKDSCTEQRNKGPPLVPVPRHNETICGATSNEPNTNRIWTNAFLTIHNSCSWRQALCSAEHRCGVQAAAPGHAFNYQFDFHALKNRMVCLSDDGNEQGEDRTLEQQYRRIGKGQLKSCWVDVFINAHTSFTCVIVFNSAGNGCEERTDAPGHAFYYQPNSRAPNSEDMSVLANPDREQTESPHHRNTIASLTSGIRVAKNHERKEHTSNTTVRLMDTNVANTCKGTDTSLDETRPGQMYQWPGVTNRLDSDPGKWKTYNQTHNADGTHRRDTEPRREHKLHEYVTPEHWQHNSLRMEDRSWNHEYAVITEMTNTQSMEDLQERVEVVLTMALDWQRLQYRNSNPRHPLADTGRLLLWEGRNNGAKISTVRLSGSRIVVGDRTLEDSYRHITYTKSLETISVLEEGAEGTQFIIGSIAFKCADPATAASMILGADDREDPFRGDWDPTGDLHPPSMHPASCTGQLGYITETPFIPDCYITALAHGTRAMAVYKTLAEQGKLRCLHSHKLAAAAWLLGISGNKPKLPIRDRLIGQKRNSEYQVSGRPPNEHSVKLNNISKVNIETITNAQCC